VARDSRDDRDDRRQTTRRGRSQRTGLRRLLGLATLLPIASRAPTYGRLFWKLVRDERTPMGRKAVLAAALGYVLVGRDLVPDELPVLGGLDDLLVVMLAVDLFLDGVPGELLDEKLGELGIDRRAFNEDVSRIRRFTPGPVRRIIRRAPGALALAGSTVQHSGLGPRVRSWINREDSIA